MVTDETVAKLHAATPARGHDVREASNGPDAFKQMEEGKEFDLILADLGTQDRAAGVEVLEWMSKTGAASEVNTELRT